MRELFEMLGFPGLLVLETMQFAVGVMGINYVNEMAHPYVYGCFVIFMLVHLYGMFLSAVCWVAVAIRDAVESWYKKRKKHE